MDLLKAITFVLAYEKQGSLSGSQRRLMMLAREQIWQTAEMHRLTAAPPQTDSREG